MKKERKKMKDSRKQMGKTNTRMRDKRGKGRKIRKGKHMRDKKDTRTGVFAPRVEASQQLPPGFPVAAITTPQCHRQVQYCQGHLQVNHLPSSYYFASFPHPSPCIGPDNADLDQKMVGLGLA